MIRDYVRLTKPGVLLGNLLTGVAGYFLASANYGYNWSEFFGVTIGMTLVVGGACALNNYLDRDIDIKMERTKTRPSVAGGLSPVGMQLFAWVLFIVGVAVLVATTNVLTVAIGVTGFVVYVWFYGAWTKRTSVHGTAVGAISGALPIAGGYAAASGVCDSGIIIAFFIMFFWQFPEFFSIAIYRMKEYKAAKIPLMPIVHGVDNTILQIFIFTTCYVISTLVLTLIGITGWVYFFIMLIAGILWIRIAYEGLHTKNHDKWARKMFKYSMYHILLLCVMLSISPLIP